MDNEQIHCCKCDIVLTEQQAIFTEDGDDAYCEPCAQRSEAEGLDAWESFMEDR